MKKLIALLFVVAMLSVLVVMPAMAANETPTIAISNGAAEVGEEVTLSVSIKNNPGIVSGKVTLVYDETVLELVAMTAVAFKEVNPATGMANYYGATALTENTELFTATFKVLAEGSSEVSAIVTGMRNQKDELIDADVDAGTIDNKCDHVFGKYTVVRASTCAKSGLKTRTCSKCGYVQNVWLSKLAHTIEIRNAKDATCTEAGYTGDEYCTVCNQVIKTGEATEAKGHGATEVKNAKAATCTAAGYTGDTCCVDCGEVITKGEEIAAAGHKWGEYQHDEDGHWQVCSVCKAAGEKAAHNGNPCSVCGYEKAGAPVALIVVIAVVAVAGAGAGAFFFLKKKKA